jgi:dienelactone hydrolase
MLSQDISYYDGEQLLIGKLIHKEGLNEKRPLVLVAPAFEGRNQFAIEKGEELARLGYIAFVMDIYGDAAFAEGVENSLKLMMPYVEDRGLLRSRVLAAFNTAKELEHVDQNNIAGVGFCFGARCILDLARAGADLKAIISFHGGFETPEGLELHPITANTLILHGNKDPMSKPESIKPLEEELEKGGALWQLNLYSEAMHAFTDPAATEVEIGRKYDAKVTAKAWKAMEIFLEDTFVS